MNEINLITFPDIIHTDAVSILFINPSKELKNQFQTEIIDTFKTDVNVYYFEEFNASSAHVDWLLNVINLVNVVVLDLDSCGPEVKSLASFIISKNKTYWLTNNTKSVYNHLSYKQKYNLDFLLQIGV